MLLFIEKELSKACLQNMMHRHKSIQSVVVCRGCQKGTLLSTEDPGFSSAGDLGQNCF